MERDVILLIILTVGTIVLNKDIILAEWFSASEDSKDKK